MPHWFKIENNTIDFRADKEYIPLIHACEITVHHIMKNYPAPYHLMVTGGLDSQLVLYSWLNFGRDYIPTHVTYNKILNHHDQVTLIQFCDKFKLTINFKDFDLLGFYQNSYDSFAKKYKLISPHFAAHLAFAEDLPGTVIYSGDRIWQRPNIHTGNICLYEHSLYKNIVPYFLMETPQIAYSLQYYIKNLDSKSKFDYRQRDKILLNEGIPVIAPLRKFTGFELVKNYYDYNFPIDVKTKLQYATRPSPRSFDLILRYPYEDLFLKKEILYLVNSLHH